MKFVNLLFSASLALACGSASVGFAPASVAQVSDAIATPIGDPLRSEDRIRLTVVGFPDLSGEQAIAADGTIQIPMVGTVSIAGLMPNEAVDRIRIALRPFVRRPQVGFVVLKRSPMHISVTGEVVKPGPRLLSPGEAETDVPMTLSRALIMAGGIKPNADLRNVTIRRSRPQTVKNAQASNREELKVDLWQVIQSGDLASDLKIRNGDEIIVPTAQATNGEQKMVLSSTVAPDKVTIQVTGEVRTPGQIEVRPTTGVNEAIAAAGGFTKEARQDNVMVLRMMPDGRLDKRTFAFGTVSEPLMNGDLIVVEKTRRGAVGDVFDFLGRVINPFAPILRLFGGSGN